jgi:hypothetical protein
MKQVINSLKKIFNKKKIIKYKLSKKLIKEYEDFIKNTDVHQLPNISKQFYIFTKESYSNINNSCINSLIDFGFNSDYTYSFYKASNSNIYVITHYLEKIFYYSLVNDNWYVLKDIIPEEDIISEINIIPEINIILEEDISEGDISNSVVENNDINNDIMTDVSSLSDKNSITNSELINKIDLKYINLIEKLIDKNYISNLPCISPKDYNKAKKYFDEIQQMDSYNYINFACNGFTTYSYYKSSNGNIYVLSLFLDELSSISLVDYSWSVILPLSHELIF